MRSRSGRRGAGAGGAGGCHGQRRETVASGCEWLVARGVRAVGYDYPPDHCIRDTIAAPRRKPDRVEYTTHAIFFLAGITVIEYLTNLDRIGVPRCRFVALSLALEGADGSPVRAGAITD